MIGAIDGDRNDTTPRKDGKLGGAPWALIGTGSDDVLLFEIPCPSSVDRTVRISYEVRGQYSTTGTILVVGQTNVTIPTWSDPVITEDVRTFDHARVTLYAGVSSVLIQATQHATENWAFQVLVAYDVLIPVVT
jgi:hypothetical protein